MKRKLTAILTAIALLTALAACSASKPEAGSEPGTSASKPETDTTETGSAPGTSFDLEIAGVSFDLPEELQNLKGAIQPSYGFEINQGSGLYLSGLLYWAIPAEKYRELSEKGAEPTEEEAAYVSPRVIDFLLVYTIDGGRTLDDLTATLPDYGLPAEGCRELGSVGEYSFFYLVNPFADILDSEVLFDEGFREEYDAVVQACENPTWIRIYEPKTMETAASDSVISFETTDIEGNPISSANLFSEHAVTMVNLWGTYCGPCINEMPDLEELNQRLADKDCAIIGVVIDVPSMDDSAMVETAKEIIADTGVTYLNLLPWGGLDTVLPAQFIPTTYFIGSDGRVIGEPAIGARGADEYEELVDAVLAQLG